MKHNIHFILRIAAVALCAMMLLTASACGEDTPDVSSEDSVTNLNIETLDPAIMEFLSRFTDWYYVEGSETVTYDSEKAGDGTTNILYCILGDAGCADWTKYSLSEPKDVYNQKKLDPKKWAKESGGAYKVFESKDADWIAMNIFNASEKDIEAMRAQGEANKWFYLEDGKYYKVIGGVGDPFTDYVINSAKTDGSVYYINYSCYIDMAEGREFRASYTAEIQQKSISGENYWTLLNFSQDESGKSADENSEIKGITGTWIEVSVYPRTLTVKEDSTYTLDEDNGKVTIDYEDHPDGSKSVWYTFTTNEGEFWTSFAKDEENEVQNDLWSGQDGAMHFMRDGIDEHLTADDYCLHTWSSGRCYITFEKSKTGYVASVQWANSAADSTQWTYNCVFDEETSSMVCKKGATRVELSTSESGKTKTKTVYKDGSGSFLIKSGTLRWTDDKEGAGNDMYLIRIDDAE